MKELEHVSYITDAKTYFIDPHKISLDDIIYIFDEISTKKDCNITIEKNGTEYEYTFVDGKLRGTLKWDVTTCPIYGEKFNDQYVTMGDYFKNGIRIFSANEKKESKI